VFSCAESLAPIWQCAGTLPRRPAYCCNNTSFVLVSLSARRKGRRRLARLVPARPRANGKTVLQGALTAAKTYVHARGLAPMGLSPLHRRDHADFCITQMATSPSRRPRLSVAAPCQRLARFFSQIKPPRPEQGLPPYLAMSPTTIPLACPLAGIQRLLLIEGL